MLGCGGGDMRKRASERKKNVRLEFEVELEKTEMKGVSASQKREGKKGCNCILARDDDSKRKRSKLKRRKEKKGGRRE